MATLREVRNRISGVKKTQKITKAMKMVAAAKLRRSQNAVVAARPYAAKMLELLQHVSQQIQGQAEPLLAQREVATVALVVVTADRGMCGAFNTNLIKAAVIHLDTRYPGWNAAGKVKLFCIGKKGVDFFSRRPYVVEARHLGVTNRLVFGQAQTIAREIVQGYLSGKYDRVDIIYNEFKSVTQSRIVTEQFLPVPMISAGAPRVPPDYIYEPSQQAILEAILPKQLNFHMWRILLESNAAEQGARMAAMENATVNANEMIHALQLQYNKARQASITKELLEVVSGAEALSKAG